MAETSREQDPEPIVFFDLTLGGTQTAFSLSFLNFHFLDYRLCPLHLQHRPKSLFAKFRSLSHQEVIVNIGHQVSDIP